MNDHVQTFNPAATVTTVNEGLQLATLLDRVISDPNIDLDRIERLLEMQERINAKGAEAAYAAAFSAMQSDMKAVAEKGRNNNTRSTYAKWEDINEMIRPVMAQHGFMLNFPHVETNTSGVTVTAKLRHKAGHSDTVTLTIPLDEPAGKNGIQRFGSSISYAKRYAAGLILNLTSTNDPHDDDGNGTAVSDLVARATHDINLAETAQELRDWKAKHLENLRKAVPQKDFAPVVSLFNKRINLLKDKEETK